MRSTSGWWRAVFLVAAFAGDNVKPLGGTAFGQGIGPEVSAADPTKAPGPNPCLLREVRAEDDRACEVCADHPHVHAVRGRHGRHGFPAVPRSVATTLWVGLILPAGWFFGNFEPVKKHFELVVIGIIVVSCIPMLVEYQGVPAEARFSAPEARTRSEVGGSRDAVTSGRVAVPRRIPERRAGTGACRRRARRGYLRAARSRAPFRMISKTRPSAASTVSQVRVPGSRWGLGPVCLEWGAGRGCEWALRRAVATRCGDASAVDISSSKSCFAISVVVFA